MIVKVQLSLASSDGLRRVLISDRAGLVHFETAEIEEVKAVSVALCGDVRGYFFAHHLPDGRISLDRRTHERDW